MSETKPIQTFYQVSEPDLDLIYNSFVNLMDRLMANRESIQALLEIAFLMAWADFTANKVLLDNLGIEAIHARNKFRENTHARAKAKAYCQKLVEAAQKGPVIVSP